MASFDDIRSKINRANEHLADLEIEIGSFYATKPYDFRVERDPKTGEGVCYLTRCDDIPAQVSIIAGDAIHNLRSALDYLAYQLVYVGTSGSGPFSNVYFPIVKSPDKLDAAIEGKVGGARKEAKDAIRAVKPYEGGNNLLWHLHRLDIIDKHRLLVAASSTGFRNLGPQDLERLRKLWAESYRSTPDLCPLTGAEWLPLKTFPLKAGAELVRGLTDAEINQQYKLHCFPAFNEPGTIERQSILGTLKSMSDLVDDITNDFAPLL